MKYTNLCNEILNNIGHKENVVEVAHCMTRLRINVAKMNQVNTASLEKIPGIMGVVTKGNQVQLIIGNDITDVYNEFMEQIGSVNTNVNIEAPKLNIFQRILNGIAEIFNPIVPALAGAGMIKALLVVLTLTNVLDKASGTYLVINTLSDSVFTFLPFLLAYSSAKKFKSNPYLAVALAGTMLHPTFSAMRAEGVGSIQFMGMSLSLVNYASSVIPIVFGTLFMSYVEKFFNRYVPKVFKVVFVPTLTLLVAIPVVLLTVGPFAQYLGNLIADAVTILFDKGGIFAGMIYGGIYSTMVVTGLHHGMVPVLVGAIQTNGYNTISPASGSANMAQAGAAFAVWLKSKNQNTKSVAASASISALLGVTEPAIYGVNLRLKKPFLAAAIGGAAGGAFAAAFGGRAYAMGGPSFATLPMFIGDDGGKWIYVMIGFMIAFAVAAIVTYFVGFEEMPLEDETSAAPVTQKALTGNTVKVIAPVDGEFVPLVDVPDPTFANGIVGNGFAIMPKEGTIKTPVSGEVVSLFKTGHAIGIRTQEGVEVLVHVGIDTVKLEGKGFSVKVKQGDTVNVGDTLVEVDLPIIKENGYSPITLVVITNKEAFPNYAIHDTVQAHYGDVLMEVEVNA